MLLKVGLLPKGNLQQVQFAYDMYKDNSKRGFDQSKLFKSTFGINVDIQWIGVWDSVSSVGFYPRELPFTNSNHIVKNFTHAVALDEVCLILFNLLTYLTCKSTASSSVQVIGLRNKSKRNARTRIRGFITERKSTTSNSTTV